MVSEASRVVLLKINKPHFLENAVYKTPAATAAAAAAAGRVDIGL
jgi:hypothetical protein